MPSLVLFTMLYLAQPAALSSSPNNCMLHKIVCKGASMHKQLHTCEASAGSGTLSHRCSDFMESLHSSILSQVGVFVENHVLHIGAEGRKCYGVPLPVKHSITLRTSNMGVHVMIIYKPIQQVQQAILKTVLWHQ